MNHETRHAGFSLIELLIAAAIFTFAVAGVSNLFVQALDLQRRATGIQKIEENAQFAIESIAREVRVSTITSGDTDCVPPDPITTRELTIEHPVNGTVTYRYDRGSGYGILFRNDEPMTSSDVDIRTFAFCVRGAGSDDIQTRLTIPMTIESTAGRPSTRVSISLQATIVSRDLGVDLLP